MCPPMSWTYSYLKKHNPCTVLFLVVVVLSCLCSDYVVLSNEDGVEESNSQLADNDEGGT